MENLQLRPMTDAEFTGYRARLIPEYAAEHVRAGDYPADQAEALAAKETDELLPDGARTPGHLFLAAADAAGVAVGLVWLNLGFRGRQDQAWIYDIEIHPGQRGKGYGRALLAAAERECVSHGVTAIALNVFGPNAVARGLYESSGYQVTTLQMRKELAG